MRLPLVPVESMSPAQSTLYEDMKSGIQTSFKGFKAIADDGSLIGPWNPWLHFPQFGEPIWGLVKALAANPTLPRNVREVAILVTGAHFHSAYEIYAHVMVAELRGLSDEKIATIAAGQRPSDLTREESIAYDTTAALVGGGLLPQLNYKMAMDAFGETGVAELINLIGLYCCVSITLNGFDVPVPE